MEIRTFHILRNQYPNCNLVNAPNQVVERVVGNFGVPPQLLGWNIRIKRDQSNSFTCCTLLHNPASELLIAKLQCLSGAITNIGILNMAENCGLDKILVRLCMNAEYHGYSLHAPAFPDNRAMQYMRGRVPLSDIQMRRGYKMLLGQVDARCEKIMMVNMHVDPNTRHWREVPRIFFNSAQHAMYDAIAYEYIDDIDNLPKITGPYFASLDEQANHFDYDQNVAEFARGNGVVRKRVVGPRAFWYFCSSSLMQ